jgi:hypothetical protein
VEQRHVLAHQVIDGHRLTLDRYGALYDGIEAVEDFFAVEDVELEQRGRPMHPYLNSGRADQAKVA